MTEEQNRDPAAGPVDSDPQSAGSDAPTEAELVETPEAAETIVPGSTDGGVPVTREELSPHASSPPGMDGPTVTAPPPDYSAAGVPSLDFVRDKIEGRYARSLGSTELAEETPEARSFQEQAAQREEAAQERLAAIRRSLRDGSSS
jgi:hypothetical protein